MRAAVLAFAFDNLGALSAVTGAHVDNLGAIGVSRALGYQDDGCEVADRDGSRVLALRFRLSAEARRQGWPKVDVLGVDDELLHLCGTKDPEGHQAVPLGGYPHAR